MKILKIPWRKICRERGIPVYDVSLSDELSSFEFAVWGVTYQLPLTYEEFIRNGWSYQGDDQASVSPQSYLENETFTMEDSAVTVDLMNPEASELPVSQCYIAGFHVDAETEEGENGLCGPSGENRVSEFSGGRCDCGLRGAQRQV